VGWFALIVFTLDLERHMFSLLSRVVCCVDGTGGFDTMLSARVIETLTILLHVSRRIKPPHIKFDLLTVG
jgi:hypothetical protein